VRVSLKGLQQAPHVTEFKYERITTLRLEHDFKY